MKAVWPIRAVQRSLFNCWEIFPTREQFLRVSTARNALYASSRMTGMGKLLSLGFGLVQQSSLREWQSVRRRAVH